MKHTKELKKNKLKVLPDKEFHKIWNAAQKKDYEAYVHMFTHPASKDRIDFEKKYDISFNAAYTLLKNIYDKANLSFKDILALTGKRKVEISNAFCIPIRTIEEWYSGNNRCPSYVRLMLLNNYYQLSLGKRVITQSEKEHRDNKPSIYAPRQIQEKYKAKHDNNDPFEEILNEMDERITKHKDIISDNTATTQEILSKTDYLKDIIRKREDTP